MIKRIILLVASPFDSRDYERFGVETLKRNGFDVEVWDLSRILRPKFYTDGSCPKPYEFKGLILFSNQKKAYEMISGLGGTDFVVTLGSYGVNSLWVYRALTRAGSEYAVHMSNFLPIIGPKQTEISAYFRKLKKIFPPTFAYVMNVLFSRLPSKWFGIKPSKLVLAGGEECFAYRFPKDKSTETLWTHAMDYDLYLEERKRSFSETERPIAVFLDEYLPFHPDRLYDGVKGLPTPDEYYPMLDRFFRRVEDELKLEVVIAASPRSDYEKKSDYFNGRRCIKGETLSLVRKSRLVLAHDSTAVTFANLFRKPVMFLTSKRLSRTHPYIKVLADWFGKEPVFADSDAAIDWDFEMSVSDRNYDEYKKSFIKVEHSRDLPFWQIVADRLKQGV